MCTPLFRLRIIICTSQYTTNLLYVAKPLKSSSVLKYPIHGERICIYKRVGGGSEPKSAQKIAVDKTLEPKNQKKLLDPLN